MEDLVYDFSPEKNIILKEHRGVCFDDVIYAIESGNILDITEHHNKHKFTHQKCIIVNISNYVYLVPCVIDQKKNLLKNNLSKQKSYKEIFKYRNQLKVPDMTNYKDGIDDKEDKATIAAFENGEMQSVPDIQAVKAKMQKAAKNYFKKDSRISIRISSTDLDMLRREAARKGLPYQSFIASVLHQFITGQFKNI